VTFPVEVVDMAEAIGVGERVDVFDSNELDLTEEAQHAAAGDRPADPTPQRVWDAVVVGGGAAAWSAALVLGRTRRSVLVVDGGAPRNAPAEHMHGYLSRDGLPPAELVRLGRAEAARYGVAVLGAQVLRIEPRFTVHIATSERRGLDDRGGRLRQGGTVQARRVLVATGSTDEIPDEIDGLRQLWGRDVHVCPYCHGWEVRDQPLAVLGTDERSVHQALLLRQWSPQVTLLTHTLGELPVQDQERLTARGVTVRAGHVSELITEGGRLRAIGFADGTRLARTAMFLMPRFVPNDALLRSLGAAVGEDDVVTVDGWGRTSVPGLYGAGNAVDPLAQVIHAAAQGSRAAIGINGDLVTEDVAHALDTYRAASCGTFSAAAEREISERVLGDRRHGLSSHAQSGTAPAATA
jgi:thioredoxin reductase